MTDSTDSTDVKRREAAWPLALIWVASIGLMILATVSFMLSFDALLVVASWGHVNNRMQWGVPVFIDGAIVVYTAVILIQQRSGKSAKFPTAMLTVFTLVSVLGNGAVAWSAGDPHAWQTWAGTFIAALPPIGVFAATHMIVRMVVAPHTVPQPAAETIPSVAAAKESAPAEVRVKKQVSTQAAGGQNAGPGMLWPQGEPADATASVVEVAHLDEDERVERIAQLTNMNLSQREIAEQLGMGKTSVGRIQKVLRDKGRLVQPRQLVLESA